MSAPAKARQVSEKHKAAMIKAYPSISGMTPEFFDWHATPEEKDEAWQRITEAAHMRAILDATYPNGWTA